MRHNNRLPVALEQHPFTTQNPNLHISRVLLERFDRIRDDVIDITADHMADPIDILVSDEVSGRIPTLIAHRYLRLAHVSGHIATVPYTRFMTSGKLDDRFKRIETQWQNNLTEHARTLLGTIAAQRVLILTEIVSSTKSVTRLVDAFEAHGVRANYSAMCSRLYLSGYDSGTTSRSRAGVEKFPRNQ